MPDPTIAACFPAALLDYAVGRGAGREGLLQRSGLSDVELGDPDARVSLARYLSLFAAAIDVCDDPALGLRFGQAVPLRDISLVGLVAQYADSMENGCELLNRYGRLTMDEGDDQPAERMALVREHGDVWVAFKSQLFVDHPILTESSFARCLCGIHTLYGTRHQGARWPHLKAIHFTHAEPPYRAEYDRLFGVPLVFGSDRNAWLIDPACLVTMQAKPDPYEAHVFRQHADALLERFDTRQSARAMVERISTPMLSSGVRMDAVCRQLGLSRQTLLRRLQAEGTTFERTVDELRKKLAIQYLTHRRLAVKQVVHELGFSDSTAFSRAFKRWTGRSPRTWARERDAATLV